MAFEIKEEFQAAVVGFNNSGLPLGKRQDLYLLAEMGLNADGSVKNKNIMNFFVTVPTLDEIKAAKEKAFADKQKKKKKTATKIGSDAAK